MKLFTQLLVLSFFLSISFNIFSQDSTNTYQGSPLFPKEGNVGISLSFDGLIDNISLGSNSNGYGQNILFVKYYLKNDLALRAGLGVDLDNYKRKTADSSGLTLVQKDSSFSRFLINVSIGIEKHLLATNRLDPYLFGQMDLTFIGKSNSKINSQVSSSAGTSKSDRTIKRDGGIAFGLVGGAGLNYFLAKRLSIGAELALGIQFVKEGGTVSDNEIFTSTTGNTTSDFNSREDQVNTASIKVQPNALINLSYFF